LRGAAIETFGVEPVLADWESPRLDNVAPTRHIAGASVETIKFAAEAAAEEVRRFLGGEPPLNAC
jgi:D-3-phosphoglycerate dehydrogenase